MNMNLFLTLGLLSCFVISGCAGEAPPEQAAQSEASHEGHDHGHDHGEAHDHPGTFADAVAEIASKTDAVKTALEADDLKTADGPVHSIGHVLEELEELASKQGLEGDQLAAVKSARDTLFAAFGGLDETIHGKEDGKTWEDVGADIEKAVSQLQAFVTESTGEEE